MLTAVILAKNEENNIKKAMESVNFCNEIILIDDNSTDNTIGIAKKYKTRVLKRALNNNFAAQRNFGLEKSRGDWILFIDADEQVTPDLRNEIQQVIENGGLYSYYIKRRDYFWGRELRFGEVSRARNKGFIRLIKKNSGTWDSPVHEAFKTTLPTGRLRNYLEHYPHQTIKEFLQDINFYSTLRAKELLKTRKSIGLLETIFYPLIKFKVNYFLKLGFLDGPAGFVYAFMMSFHSFLVRAKLYQYLYLK